ncbi:class I SAM-dependent methyltransferase [Acidothermaceae bacterium B102]|nr:class I SAM-dependent methyltransferase [Acidothermaceae bacterium B102]
MTTLPSMASLRARSFGPVADIYDRIRPGYPAELFADLLSYVTPPLARVIEVGAGTGRATLALTEHGLAVHAIEPDPLMAAVLRERVPSAEVTVGSFEQTPTDGAYDLLVSAQAWHWVDPLVRWTRAEEVLRPGGSMALFWNHDHPADPDVADRLQAAHQRWTPDIRIDDPLPEGDAADQWPGPHLAQLSAFTDLESRRYSWQRVLTGTDYVELLSTMSKYRVQSEATRSSLLADLRDVAGDQVVVSMDTVLYLARRTS